MLHRSLMGMGALIERSVTEPPPTWARTNQERFLVAELIKELAPSAALEAHAKGIKLRVV